MAARKALHTAGSVYVTQNKKGYRVLWRENDRQRERNSTSLDAAIEICEAEALRLNDGQPDHRDVTVGDLVEGYIAAGIAGEFQKEWGDGQVEQQRSLLDGHLRSAEGAGLEQMKCVNLSRKDASNAVAKIVAAGYSMNTIKHFSKACTRVVNFGLASGVFKPEPARQLKLGFKVPDAAVAAEIATSAASGAMITEVPTGAQVNAFVAAMHEANSTYGTLAELSATTGLRWEEAVALRAMDIDIEAGTVSVRQARKRKKGGTYIGMPKTRSSVRTVRLTDAVTEQLKNLIAGVEPTGWVFITARGDRQPISSSSSFRRSWWKPAADKTGYSPFTWHDLRHYYATRQLAAGVPLANVSAALGHASVRVTADVYIGSIDALETSVAAWA